MAYAVKVDQFEGPLDLLLQLVEKNEVEISAISLGAVAEHFVTYVHEQNVPPEELADFLVVASKLVYIKSKLLLPDFEDSEMEEGPDLETQLRQYQRFVAAAKRIDAMWVSGNMSFTRGAPSVSRPTEHVFRPPQSINITVMLEAMRRVIARIEPIIRLPKASVRRAVSLHERIKDLMGRIRSHAGMTFKSFIHGTAEREDVVVSFLALLELIKQRFITVAQQHLFHDISIQANPDAPAVDPFVESFL